jgi:hypothetical protein
MLRFQMPLECAMASTARTKGAVNDNQERRRILMIIKNETDITVAWFCYNQQDALKWVALGSGDLSDKSGSNQKTYQPPKNSNDLYFLRFTYAGGGTELGGQVLSDGQTITISGAGDHYHTSVS